MTGLMRQNIPKSQRVTGQCTVESVGSIKHHVPKIREIVVGQYVAGAIESMT